MNLPFFSALKTEWQSLLPFHKWLAISGFGLLLALRAYFLWLYPLHIDEVYTYTVFMHEGIWQSLSYYPIPNNHVFLSVFGAVFAYFIDSGYWVLRTCAFLISLLLTPFIFFAFKRYTSFWTAFLGVGLFCFSNIGLYYSVHARGYFLLTGFSVAAALAMLSFVRTGNRKVLWVFVGASALGFYTIPVFLYSFAATAFFGFLICVGAGLKKRLFELIIACSGVGILTILLYTPIFVVSGVHSVIGNEYVVPLSFKMYSELFLSRLIYVQNSLIGREPNSYYGSILLLVSNCSLLGIGLWKTRAKVFSQGWFQWVLLITCMQVMPVLICTIQRVLPDARIFLYLSVFQFMGLAWLLTFAAREFNFQRIVPVLALSGMLIYATHQFRVLRIYRQTQLLVYDQLEGWVKIIQQNKPARTFMQHSFYKYFTLIYFIKEDRKIEIDETNFDPEKNYEFVLLKNDEPKPERLDLELYNRIYQDDFTTGYKKREGLDQ